MPTLFHYTSQAGIQGIVSSGVLWASKKATNPRDVRYGDGQYLTDILPSTMNVAQLSRALIGHPFQGRRFTHFVEIEVSGLIINKPRQHVFVIHNSDALDVSQRIVSTGAN